MGTAEVLFVGADGVRTFENVTSRSGSTRNSLGVSPEPKPVGALRLSLDDRETTIRANDSARIGSGLGAHVVSSSTGVELSHATVRVENNEWVLRDHSSQGIWADGQRIVLLRVDGPMAVRLGAPDGPVLILDLDAPTGDTPCDRSDGSVRSERTQLRRRSRFGRSRGRHFRRD